MAATAQTGVPRRRPGEPETDYRSRKARYLFARTGTLLANEGNREAYLSFLDARMEPELAQFHEGPLRMEPFDEGTLGRRYRYRQDLHAEVSVGLYPFDRLELEVVGGVVIHYEDAAGRLQVHDTQGLGFALLVRAEYQPWDLAEQVKATLAVIDTSVAQKAGPVQVLGLPPGYQLPAGQFNDAVRRLRRGQRVKVRHESMPTLEIFVGPGVLSQKDTAPVGATPLTGVATRFFGFARGVQLWTELVEE